MIAGSMPAADPHEVSRRLRAEGRTVVSVTARSGRDEDRLDSAQIRRDHGAKSIRRDDVVVFCEQMSVMLETGVPLAEALGAYCAQVRRPEQRAVFEALRADLMHGETFSTAAQRWPGVFPGIMISLLRASEASGTLGMMLGRIARYLRKERQTARQIRGAVAYPAFMVGAALVLSAFLVVVILPKFATIYAGKAAALPGPTRALLAVSEFAGTQWKWYLPLAVGAMIAAWVFARRPTGRRWIDWLRVNLPVLGRLYRKLYISRACRTMGTLLAANVSLLDIIELVRGVTNNSEFDRIWDRVERDVREGRHLSDAFVESGYIPSNVSTMITSGERSGRLAEVMDRLAEFADQELDAEVKQVTAFIEPVMIMIMGVVIGGVALALLLPIFRMGSVMAG